MRDALNGLDLFVEIDEGEAEVRGEAPPERGLADAHEPSQGDPPHRAQRREEELWGRVTMCGVTKTSSSLRDMLSVAFLNR